MIHCMVAACIMLGLLAAFKSHSLKRPIPIPNLYSAHSCLGLSVVCLAAGQVSSLLQRPVDVHACIWNIAGSWKGLCACEQACVWGSRAYRPSYVHVCRPACVHVCRPACGHVGSHVQMRACAIVGLACRTSTVHTLHRLV